MAHTILIVDDGDKNVLLLKDVLDATGYTTVLARNGLEAVALAGSEKPDLILMDFQMPVMNGIDATAKIREDPELVDVPIYAVTASVMAEQCLEAREAGVNDVISKPVNIRDLLSRIKALLDGAAA